MPTDPTPHAVEGVTLDEAQLATIEENGGNADALFTQARAALRLGSEVIRLAAEVERLTKDREHWKDLAGIEADHGAEVDRERDALRTQLAAAEARVAELTGALLLYVTDEACEGYDERGRCCDAKDRARDTWCRHCVSYALVAGTPPSEGGEGEH